MKKEVLFQELFACRKSTVGRYLNMHKRAFDEWAMKILIEKGFTKFKMSYFPIVMNIGPHGSTNKDIAASARVTKQAMSKVLQELYKMKLVRFDTHPIDGRSSMVYLTQKGVEMVMESRTMVMQLEKEYEQKVGKRNYAIYKKVMQELISLHWEGFA